MDHEPAPSKRKVGLSILAVLVLITISVVAGPTVWSNDGPVSVSDPLEVSLQGWTFGDANDDVLAVMRHKDVIRALGSQRFEITEALAEEGVYEGLVPGRTGEGCYRGAWFVEYTEHTVERTSKLISVWKRKVVSKHMDLVFFKLEGPAPAYCSSL
jgi:hypothetical protein